MITPSEETANVDTETSSQAVTTSLNEENLINEVKSHVGVVKAELFEV